MGATEIQKIYKNTKIYQFKPKDSKIKKTSCVYEIFQEIFQLIT